MSRSIKRKINRQLSLASVLALGLSTGVFALQSSNEGLLKLPTASAASQDTVYIDEPFQVAGNLDSNEWHSAAGQYTNIPQRGSNNSPLPPISPTGVQGEVRVVNSLDLDPGNGEGTPWLQLTSDYVHKLDPNTAAGQSAYVYNKTPIPSNTGVVIEYDQRMFRTWAGEAGAGAGDGISVFLIDADTPDASLSQNSAFGWKVDTTPDEPGAYGAGLGYAPAASQGGSWTPLQQGVANGYVGIGFDVFGNYQKAESNGNIWGGTNGATRPHWIGGGSPLSRPSWNGNPTGTYHPDYSPRRIPQSIGLRGSGVRHDNGQTLVAGLPFDSAGNIDATGGLKATWNSTDYKLEQSLSGVDAHAAPVLLYSASGTESAFSTADLGDYRFIVPGVDPTAGKTFKVSWDPNLIVPGAATNPDGSIDAANTIWAHASGDCTNQTTCVLTEGLTGTGAGFSAHRGGWKQDNSGTQDGYLIWYNVNLPGEAYWSSSQPRHFTAEWVSENPALPQSVDASTVASQQYFYGYNQSSDSAFGGAAPTHGGYQWLAGTGYLGTPISDGNAGDSVAPSPNGNNAAWLDNGQQNSNNPSDPYGVKIRQDYRKVKVAITPAGNDINIQVYMSEEKLSTGDDVKICPGGELDCSSTDEIYVSDPDATWEYELYFEYTLPKVSSSSCTLPSSASDTYTTGTCQANYPDNFYLGFAASNGYAVNYHQIRNLKVTGSLDAQITKEINGVDSTHLQAGNAIEYTLGIKNNGPADIMEDYPAAIIEPLTDQNGVDLPIETNTGGPIANLPWTATVSTDSAARICYGTQAECSGTGADWQTSITGTGPLPNPFAGGFSGDALWFWAPSYPDDGIAAENQIVVTYNGKLAASANVDDTLINTSCIQVNPNAGPGDTDPSNDCDSAQFTVAKASASYTLDKSSNPASGRVVSPGESIIYTVTANGTVPAPGPTITDDLSKALFNENNIQIADFVGVSDASGTILDPQPGTVSAPNADNDYTLTWTPGAINGPNTLHYVIKLREVGTGPKQVTAGDVLGKKLYNVVTGTGPTPDDCPSNSDCRTTTHETPLWLKKVDVNGDTVSGAEFAIYDVDPSDPLNAGATPVANPTSSGDDGNFEIEPLPAGNYWLVETRAPSGHNLLAQAVAFSIEPRTTGSKEIKITLLPPTSTQVTLDDSGVTLTITDLKPMPLPLAGFDGQTKYILSGGTLIFAAMLAYYGAQNRRPKRVDARHAYTHASR